MRTPARKGAGLGLPIPPDTGSNGLGVIILKAAPALNTGESNAFRLGALTTSGKIALLPFGSTDLAAEIISCAGAKKTGGIFNEKKQITSLNKNIIINLILNTYIKLQGRKHA